MLPVLVSVKLVAALIAPVTVKLSKLGIKLKPPAAPSPRSKRIEPPVLVRLPGRVTVSPPAPVAISIAAPAVRSPAI